MKFKIILLTFFIGNFAFGAEVSVNMDRREDSNDLKRKALDVELDDEPAKKKARVASNEDDKSLILEMVKKSCAGVGSDNEEELIDEIKQVIEKNKADINAQDGTGMTPLLWAMQSDKNLLAKFFLDQNNLNINLEDFDGLNPLILSIIKQNFELFQMILAKRPNLCARWIKGKKRIMDEKSYLLVGQGKSRIGYTPLMQASADGLEKFVEALIKANANPTLGGHNLREYINPETLAKNEQIKKILGEAESIWMFSGSSILGMIDKDRFVYDGPTMKVLLDVVKVPFNQTLPRRYTPNGFQFDSCILLDACIAGEVEIVKKLISMNADVNVNLRDLKNVEIYDEHDYLSAPKDLSLLSSFLLFNANCPDASSNPNKAAITKILLNEGAIMKRGSKDFMLFDMNITI